MADDSLRERLLAVMDRKNHWGWPAFVRGEIPLPHLLPHFTQEWETFVRDFPVMLARVLGHGPPDDVRRAIKRFGSSPDNYRYHTLTVRPPGASTDHPGEEVGSMPWHKRRGNYARDGPKYGKGLLFGQHEGKFYRPATAVGDKKNGVVEKDYAVPSNSI